MYTVLHLKYLLFLSDFNNCLIFSACLEILVKSKFIKPVHRSTDVSWGQTNWRTDGQT